MWTTTIERAPSSHLGVRESLKYKRSPQLRSVGSYLASLLVIAGSLLSTSQASAQSWVDSEHTLGDSKVDAKDPWQFTAGIGVGSLYSTAEINVGVHNSKSLAVLSVGCGSGSSLNGCHESFLLGYYRTDLFGSTSGRHAFGIWGGQTDSSAYHGVDYVNQYPLDLENLDFDPVWGVGVGYLYFHNGIGNPGPAIGLGYQIERGDNHSREGRFMLSLGFQFW